MKPTLTYFLGTIRNTIVTAIFLGQLSCRTAYLIYSSLARISCGLESIFTITLEVYYKLTVRHDLSIIFHTFFFFLNLLCNYLILLCKSYSFFEPRGYVSIGAPPCSSLRSRHITVMIMYVFSGDESQ